MSTEHLKTIEQRLLWLSHWMIHHANHVRPKVDGIKIGGHQASSASMVSIMTALYFSVLRPEDRVAVKPHASPIFHAIQYLMGNQTREKMENFRGYGGVQSYPSRTKDIDDVDFSTGSVGLGVAITSFASLVQDYIAAKSWSGDKPLGRMIALVGDAELDEGNVYEALQEGWKNDLRNCWWIIDYNRQSLDGIFREGLFDRVEKIFDAFGWQVVRVKYGVLQRAAFAEPGGDKLRQWIDDCSNQDYSALTFMGGAVWRKRLMDDLGDQGDVTALIDRRSDDELADLMENLGGNCTETMAEAFAAIDHDKPTCFLAYTIKGWGTPIAGHKDNHGGLMNKTQMAEWQKHMGVAEGEEWEPFATVPDVGALKAFLDQVPFFAKGTRRFSDDKIAVPAIELASDRDISTQMAFGKVLEGAIGDVNYIQTTYNTTGWVPAKARQEGWSDAEFMLRNWQYFHPLSGDHIVEQSVHAIDWIAWAMGDQPPVRCYAVGGRQVRADKPETGNVYDHFSVTYEYPNGVRATNMCRHWPNSASDNTAFVQGTTGHLNMQPWTGNHVITGKTPWRGDATGNDMYQREHDVLFKGIRNGSPFNDGVRMAHTTLLAIMGREAAYTGQMVTWEDPFNADHDLNPEPWEFSSRTIPTVAIPGTTRFG